MRETIERNRWRRTCDSCRGIGSSKETEFEELNENPGEGIRCVGAIETGLNACEAHGEDLGAGVARASRVVALGEDGSDEVACAGDAREGDGVIATHNFLDDFIILGGRDAQSQRE